MEEGNKKESLLSKLVGKVIYIVFFFLGLGAVTLVIMFAKGDVSIVFHENKEESSPGLVEPEVGSIEVSSTEHDIVEESTTTNNYEVDALKDEQFAMYVIETYPSFRASYDSFMNGYSIPNADIPKLLEEVRSKANTFALGLQQNPPSNQNMQVVESLFNELNSIVRHVETLKMQYQVSGKDAIDTYNRLPTKIEYVESVYNQVKSVYE